MKIQQFKLNVSFRYVCARVHVLLSSFRIVVFYFVIRVHVCVFYTKATCAKRSIDKSFGRTKIIYFAFFSRRILRDGKNNCRCSCSMNRLILQHRRFCYREINMSIVRKRIYNAHTHTHTRTHIHATLDINHLSLSLSLLHHAPSITLFFQFFHRNANENAF